MTPEHWAWIFLAIYLFLIPSEGLQAAFAAGLCGIAIVVLKKTGAKP